MKITPTYSEAGDTAYVAFGEPREVIETIAPLEDLAIDLDAAGRVVGIEFVTASRYLDPSVFEEEPGFEDLIGVTEIAEVIGKRKQNVAQHYSRLSDFPRPVAELPTGRYWRRGDVLRWYEQSRTGLQSKQRQTELALAAEWLTTCLSHRAWPAPELHGQADKDGVPWSAVRRAAKAIGVETRKADRTTMWDLPAKHPSRRSQK